MLNVEIFTQRCTEFFWKWIMLKRATQRRFTRTSFKFQVSDFRFLNVDFFWNSDDTDLADEHGFFNLKELK